MYFFYVYADEAGDQQELKFVFGDAMSLELGDCL